MRLRWGGEGQEFVGWEWGLAMRGERSGMSEEFLGF